MARPTNAPDGVGVRVGVPVAVGCGDDVAVCVIVGRKTIVTVGVGVAVGADVAVDVAVGVTVRVGVRERVAQETTFPLSLSDVVQPEIVTLSPGESASA